MDSAKFDEFNALLLELYRASAELPLESYQDTVLETLKPLLAFDASMWGTAVFMPGQGIDIHTIHLHNQPQEMVAAYEEVKHLDTSAATVVGKPRVTKGFHSPSWFDDPQWNGYRDFQQRFGHENVFITAHTDPGSGFTQWVSLFRADDDRHCRPNEVHLLAQLAPHLMQGLNHNRSRHLDRLSAQAGGPHHEAAIADARGVIYYATPGCASVLRAEWESTWRPNRLPEPLLQWASSTPEPFLGRTLVAKHHVQKDLLFVRLRPLCAADRLPARQRQIAHLTARGLSHKEVAQQLGLAPATVRTQLQNIYRNLQVQSIAGLATALRDTHW